MDHELTEAGRAFWKSRVTDLRRRVGTLAKLERPIGLSEGQISRFEGGAPDTLRAWFKKGHAAKYAAAVGTDLATLERLLAEAGGAGAQAGEWHPAFAGLSLREAWIPPRVKVTGLPGDAPRDVGALLEHLKAAGDDVTVRVPPARGVGRPSFVAWLQGALPENATLEEAPAAAEDRRPKWMVLSPLDPDTGRTVVTVEPLPWDADQLERLANHLQGLGRIEASERARVDRRIAQLRSEKLEVGPDTAIGLLVDAMRGGVGTDDLVDAVADAQWALARRAGNGLERTDATWLYRFWAQRRVDCVGLGWLWLTREAALAAMGDVCRREGAAPVDRAALRERLAVLRAAPSAGRSGLEKLERDLAVPSPEELVDAVIAGGVLIADGEWVHPANESLAEAFAARGLVERLAEVAADEALAWALDPSWWPMLRRLGALGADPTPLLTRWRTASPRVRARGAIALAHVYAFVPVPAPAQAEGVREVHAALLWTLLADCPDATVLRSQLPQRVGARELTGPCVTLSERWAEHLGFFGPEPLEGLTERVGRPEPGGGKVPARPEGGGSGPDGTPPGSWGAADAQTTTRVPTDLRGWSTVSGGVLEDALVRNGDASREERAAVAIVCLSPWQCPPVDDLGWRRWWDAGRFSGFVVRPQPEADRVLERAHGNGHRDALAVLAGSAPHWSNLDWETRCRWVGRAGTAAVVEDRFVELVTRRRDGADGVLEEAADRLGQKRIASILKRLSTCGTPESPSWSGEPAWLLRSPANARLGATLGAAAGAGAALVELYDAIAKMLSSWVPAVDVEEPRSRRSARILGDTRPDCAAVEHHGEALRRAAWVPSTASPVWLPHAADLVADVLAWEGVRHAIAVSLAERGNVQQLRSRGLDGPGWEWSERVCSHLELSFRVAAVHTTGPGPSLLSLARRPVPDAEVFLAALRARGLARAEEWGLRDDGSYFPATDGAGSPLLRRDHWVASRGWELEDLHELANSPRGEGVRRSLAVLSWCSSRRAGLGPRRGDFTDALWAWLGEVADLRSSVSLAHAVVTTVDRAVRLDAARELVRRRDPGFLAALWTAGSDGVLLDARREAEAALDTDSGLRAAVWEHVTDVSVRAHASHRENQLPSPAAWARAEAARREARHRALVLGEPDPLTRVGLAIQHHCPLTPEEAEAVVAAWWVGPELLAIPRYRVEGNRFTPSDLLGFVATRFRAGAFGLVPQVRGLWEALLDLPVVEAVSLDRDAALTALPADLWPPDLWEAVVELVRLLPHGDALLDAAWRREDWEVAHVVALELGRPHAAWDDDDLWRPVLRADLHRCWLLHCAEDALHPTLLDPDAAAPGVLRLVLRERLSRTAPERVLPWIAARLDAATSEEIAGAHGMLWLRWAEVRPADAWAWLTTRWEADASAREGLRWLANHAVVMIESVVPGARRWLVEAA